MTRKVFEQVGCFEAVSLEFGFEEFFGHSFLTVFSEVRGGNIVPGMIRHGFGEGFMFPFRPKFHQ